MDFNRVYSEYVFAPNPTDIDRQINIPNDIQPDQLSGFYVNVNKPGTFYITVRGTTGQKKKSSLNRITDQLGISGVSEIASLTGMSQAAGLDEGNGYTEYVALTNFFYDWFDVIGDEPSRYAMIWLNAKDVEFFRVYPMSLQFPRTSARPIHYGYAITLQAVSEERPSGRFGQALSTMDRINQIRSNMNRWKQAVTKAIISVSYLAHSLPNMGFNVGIAEANNVGVILDSMADGLQSLAYMSTSMHSSASNTRSWYKDIREQVSDTIRKYQDNDSIPAGNMYIIAPPTRAVCREIFNGVSTIMSEVSLDLNRVNPGGKTSSIDPASPFIDSYGSSLELLMESDIAIDLAPLPDYDPISDSYGESKSMHRAARAGSVGMLEGREDELASASYYAESYVLDGTRNPSGITNDSVTSYSLSYITASILQTWGSLHDASLSPSLQSFRAAFLGMHDPSTLSPVYKTIVISSGDTIYSLAEKHLGTWERWAEIALINGLDYPYISKNNGLRCRIVGDEIYVPTRTSRISADTLETLQSIVDVHDKLNLNSVFLGFDIYIDPTTKDAQYEKYDYAFVSGFDAFVQELGFVLEGFGGLTSDPEPGIGIRIGTKSGGLRDIALWKGTISKWLSSDYRVEKVGKVDVQQDGGTIYFSTVVKFYGIDDSQIVASRIRR